MSSPPAAASTSPGEGPSARRWMGESERGFRGMAQLKDKVKTTLDEARMLILGSQVLLGFQFRATLEKGFDKLPEHAKYTKFWGLALMILAVVLLMWPGAYHQIVEDGEDTEGLQRFAT